MKFLPSSIFVLILYMGLFFNIDRLKLEQFSPISLQGFVYVLVSLAVLITIMVQFMRRAKIFTLLAIWDGLYLLFKLWILPSRPFIGGNFTYLTILEISLLSLAVLVANNVAKNLEDFIQAVENITFEGWFKVNNVDDAADEIQTEIYRSRRFNHALSLVMVEPEPESVNVILHRTIKDVQRSMIARYISVSLARSLHRKLRQSDILLEKRGSKQRFIILAPETSKFNISEVIKRVNRAAFDLGAALMYGVASYPEDSMTFEGLMKRAEKNLEHTFKVTEELQQDQVTDQAQNQIEDIEIIKPTE